MPPLSSVKMPSPEKARENAIDLVFRPYLLLPLRIWGGDARDNMFIALVLLALKRKYAGGDAMRNMSRDLLLSPEK